MADSETTKKGVYFQEVSDFYICQPVETNKQNRIWQLQAPGCVFESGSSPQAVTLTPPPPPFFFSPRPCLLFSCPTQWGRILLVAMTSVQCLYEMHPLTVWTAGQDRDTSRFKEKLLSGTAGRGTQTPRSVSNPDPVSWNGTFSRATEVQRETLDGGVTGQCWSCRSASLDWSVHLWVRTAWMCLFRRERGGWKLRERSSWLQNGLRSMNPIGGLGWFLLLLTCLWLQWWALLMWWETAGSFYPCVLFNYNFLALSLSQEF